MTQTTHLALPFIDAAQAQKHVTHNEALQLLDALVHLAVSARNQTAPPALPTEGLRCLVGLNATGAFAGKDFQIATYLAGAWSFLAPVAGWRVYVESEDAFLVYDGALWSDVGLTLRLLQSLTLLGIGTTADAANPLSAKLNASLFTAKSPAEGGTGDLRMTLNKSGSANTASHIYQTNYSSRAEIGLTGDDRLRVKVSADGASWKEAMNIDSSTGFIGVGVASASVALHSAGAVRTGVYAVTALPSPAQAGGGARAFVDDATSTTFGTVALGGGTLKAPVYCDGASWLIG